MKKSGKKKNKMPIKRRKALLIKSLIGLRVKHRIYGYGIIESIQRHDDPIFNICFENGNDIREFNLSGLSEKFFELNKIVSKIDKLREIIKIENRIAQKWREKEGWRLEEKFKNAERLERLQYKPGEKPYFYVQRYDISAGSPGLGKKR
jgi:hypothetical protein